MSINYGMLKDSEEKLIGLFSDYFEQVISEIKKLVGLYTAGEEGEKIIDYAISCDRRSARKYQDILDECMWTIQKNEPRASHLRLIIAIVNSLNDVKRLSNYGVTFGKFCNKENKISDKLKKKIIKICNLSISYMDQFYGIYTERQWETGYQKAQKIFDSFLKEYKPLTMEILKINEVTVSNEPSYISRLIIILKNLDRYVDRCMNILENYSLVS